MKLNRTTLKSLQTGPKARWVFDERLPGFGLRLRSTGAASWVVVFRIRGSRTKRTVTLGPLATLSPEEAYERGRLVLAAAREGRDLNHEARKRAQAAESEKRARANRTTVADAVAGYLNEFATRISPQTGRVAAPSSVAILRGRLRRLVDRHGERAVADLEARDVAAIITTVPARNRRNVFGAVARMLAFAKKRGHVAAVVTSDLEPPPVPPARTSTPSPEEVRVLLDKADEFVTNGRWAGVQRDAFALLCLTGQRRSEIATLDWGDIDLTRALWTQAPQKNKAHRTHVVPLAPRVLDLLKARYEAAGRPREGLVLKPPRQGRTVYEGLATIAETLRTETGLVFKLHDMRRAMTSACADRGVAFETLDSLLNHAASATRGGLRGTYNKSVLLEPMRKAVEIWEGAVYGTVVPLRRPA